MKPVHLNCEYLQDPRWIDVLHPRLSWKLSSERRGAQQTAYRLLVASSLENLEREVMERIKEYDPDIEVIIVTGYSSLESAVRGLRFGAFDYISKPFDVPQVSDLVRRAVARRRAHLAYGSPELRNPESALLG